MTQRIFISYRRQDNRGDAGYAKRSDDVFKKLGGKPLERFITHP